MPFKIIRNDITKMQVDAIVNTANEAPIYSSGTDTAIYEAAGVGQLLKARTKIGFLKEGEVAITPGFSLSAKYIIHAVSPYYIDGRHGEEEKLKSCYERSLQMALQYGCESIAFPLIATGSFGYPKDEGMEIALGAIHSFLMKEEMLVYLVVFDNESVRLSGQIFDDIESYIDEHYVAEQEQREYRDYSRQQYLDCCMSMPLNVADVTTYEEKKTNDENNSRGKIFEEPMKRRSLEDIMSNVGETFQQRLFRHIDEQGRTDADVYKAAGKDKKLFHKIRNNVNYHPTKLTAFAFAIALKLNIDETKDLLASAGYAFSPSSQFDLVMRYVFEHEIYDIYKIDCILYDLNLKEHFGYE